MIDIILNLTCDLFHPVAVLAVDLDGVDPDPDLADGGVDLVDHGPDQVDPLDRPAELEHTFADHRDREPLPVVTRLFDDD